MDSAQSDSVHSTMGAAVEPIQPKRSEAESSFRSDESDSDRVDELLVLDGLESDLLAVEQAIANLDQIPSASEEGESGETTEAAILDAVPEDRFTPLTPTQS